MAEDASELKQSKKMRVEEISEISADETSGEPELMDLPEPVLIQILSYLDHDFLRNVAFFVSREWKRLAQSHGLWLNASLRIEIGTSFPGICEEPDHVRFRDILVTPHVDNFDLNLYYSENNGLKSRTLAALLSSRCTIRNLKLNVENYSPELVLFLQQHPELEELEIMDSACEDDDNASGVAAAIGHLIPHLKCLDISFSSLPFLTKAGSLLVSPPTPHGKLNLVESSLYPPVCSEPQNVSRPLHLRVDSEIGQPLEVHFSDGQLDKQQGLQQLKCIADVGIFYKPTPLSGSAVDNLSALILAHKHSLKSVQIWLPYFDVFKALAECTELEELEVHSDWDGSGICAMLRNMRSTPRRLVVLVPKPLGPRRLGTVLETLSQHASLVENLKITNSEYKADTGLFPGFKPLQALLIKSRRGTTPALRELEICGLGPVGRAQIQELTSMAISNGGLSLSKLHLFDCTCCNFDASGEECRDRALDALKQAAPSLEYTVKHYSPNEDGCGCVGVVPPPHPPQ